MYFLHCFEVSPQRQLDPEGLLTAVHTKYQGPENKKQQLQFCINKNLITRTHIALMVMDRW